MKAESLCLIPQKADRIFNQYGLIQDNNFANVLRSTILKTQNLATFEVKVNLLYFRDENQSCIILINSF